MTPPAAAPASFRDGFYVAYDRHVTGETTHIRENGAASGIGVLATFAYDDRGRRISLARGNGLVTTYGHDAASRLSQLVLGLGGGANDLTLGFSYNPASQIVSNTRSNDAFALAAQSPGTTASTVDGRNRLTQTGADAVTHDARGNVTAIGSTGYAFTAENRLHTRGGATYAYDGLGRLYYHGATYTWWDHDGGNLVAEIHHPNNSIQRRWVHGPGVDEPLVQYEGSGTTDRRWLHADERGSIVAISDSSGTVTAVNRYDEYGTPATGNTGRFQYTGQPWLPEAGLYYSRARMYHPQLGRFLQTDPIGYGDGMNMYTYVGGDPVNHTDPTGLSCEPKDLVCTVNGLRRADHAGFGGGGGGVGLGAPRERAERGGVDAEDPNPIVVTGLRRPRLNVFGGNAGRPNPFICIAGGQTRISVGSIGDMISLIITGQIAFSGPGANRQTNASYIGAINSAWNGIVGGGRYFVTTALGEGPGGISATVRGQAEGWAVTDRLGGSNVWLDPLTGTLCDQVPRGQAAHEFGHVLGAIDRYSSSYGPVVGYEQSIMGNGPRGYLDVRLVEEVLDQCV